MTSVRDGGAALDASESRFMRRALELAALGRGRTSPNPMVGAVLVRDGRIVGEGFHARAGLPHAEVVALLAAGDRARGATLFVTLEPCSHRGRTPPCADAVVQAGVSRVVAAMVDPNPRVRGRGFERLRAAGLAVEVGLLADEARALNEAFVFAMEQGRPLVTLKWAMTLDGKIATASGDSRWVTGEAARLRVHRMRDQSDAILVGVGTVLADDPSLTTRLPGGGGKDAMRIILDSRARTPPEARVVGQESLARTVIATGLEAPEDRVTRLEAAGAEVWRLPTEVGRVSLAALMDELSRREVRSVLVEGGAGVHAAFLAAGLADKLVAFVAPRIAGGSSAPGPVGGAGVLRMAEAWELEHVAWHRMGTDLMVCGDLRRPDATSGKDGRPTEARPRGTGEQVG